MKTLLKIIEEVDKIIKCNEEVETNEVTGEKEIVKSDTDKDAGMLYKNEKEKVFRHNSTVICDNNNYGECKKLCVKLPIHGNKDI